MFELYIVFVALSSAAALDVQFSADLGPRPQWTYRLRPAALRWPPAPPAPPSSPGGTVPDLVSQMIEKYAPKGEAHDILDHMLIHKMATNNDVTVEGYHLMQTIQGEAVKDKKKKGKDGIKSTLQMHVTKPDAGDKGAAMYCAPRRVRDDAQITEFTKHIYKQSLKVFDAIKEKATDDATKKEVAFLAQSYEEKFGDFVKETQDLNIKTRLGRQKVIMNTLETSNLILKRLVNYLVRTDRNSLRSGVLFQNEVNKKMEMENNHICKKFGICRTQNGAINFIVEVISIIVTADDRQVKQAADAFTEVMKYADFSHVMSPETETHFQKGIADLEGYDVTLLRPILYIIKNVLLHKNKPIKVVGPVDKRVNKTIGALEMADALEAALPPNEENRLLWDDARASLEDWRDGKRHDVLEIMQTIVDHVKKGMDSFDEKTAKNFERNLNLILGSL